MMEEKEYTEELDKLFHEFGKNVGLLQEELTEEEIIKYASHMEVDYLTLLKMMVGDEMLIHYLIQLLNTASKLDWNKRKLSNKSLERYKDVKKKNLEDVR